MNAGAKKRRGHAPTPAPDLETLANDSDTAAGATLRRRAARRGAQLERDAARAMGSTRTARIGSRMPEPDVASIFVGGLTLQPECKARARVPKVILDAMAQALRYAPRAVPIVVLRPRGEEALVIVGLAAWCQLVGLAPERLPSRHRPTPRDPRQLTIAGCS